MSGQACELPELGRRGQIRGPVEPSRCLASPVSEPRECQQANRKNRTHVIQGQLDLGGADLQQACLCGRLCQPCRRLSGRLGGRQGGGGGVSGGLAAAGLHKFAAHPLQAVAGRLLQGAQCESGELIGSEKRALDRARMAQREQGKLKGAHAKR